MRYLLLAFASGAPALAYELVWSREVALAAGAQVEAVAVVLAAYFAGLALGARVLGARVDRAGAPLRFYGVLEGVAACTAVASLLAVRALAEGPLPALPMPARLAVLGALLLPTTFSLGGTLPALLRAAEHDAERAPRTAGWLLGANTVGAASGVAVASWLIPTLGLAATLKTAALCGAAVGFVALVLARRETSVPSTHASKAEPAVARLPVVAAFVAGVATLGFEVSATRMLALQLGSSLFAFAMVLFLFLAGLGLGNLAAASRAARSGAPMRDLAWIQTGAALLVVAAVAWLRPPLATSAGGFAEGGLAPLLFGVFAPAFSMGAAFPFFVRAAVTGPEQLGSAMGRVSAWNTGGGVVGSLCVPFVLLPSFGLTGAVLACAALNLGLALWLHVVGSRGGAERVAAALAFAATVALAFFVARPAPLPPELHVLFVEHGRQASVVVSRTASHRDLLVDGDPEASTAPGARITEELLAVLPILHHPGPRALLEVGFGSGISLGAAARFPFESIECVEIASSVLAAGGFFAPQNRGVADGSDTRITIIHDDGRAHLLRRPASFDIVLANTVQPWSLGATGLYSVEYFQRLARSLRPGGIAAQWLPLQKLSREDLEAILRSFYHVFAEGTLYWGANNLLVLGAQAPIALPARGVIEARLAGAGLDTARWEIADAAALSRRRIASADVARRVLGSGHLLSDDRPALEASSLRSEPGREVEVLASVLALADAGRADAGLVRWIEAQAARARGAHEAAGTLQAEAERLGLAVARRARLTRELSLAERARLDGKTAVAEGRLVTLLREEDWPAARFARARMLQDRGDDAGAEAELVAVVEAEPSLAPAWVRLGVLRAERGALGGARRAFEQALVADPFLPEALANLGLLAHSQGDTATARRMAETLRGFSPLGAPEALVALDQALAGL